MAFFNNFKRAVGLGTVTFGHTLNAVLLTSSYTVDYAVHLYYSHLTNEVANGNGYTTGGQALTSVAWTQDGTSVRLTADNLSWTDATFTCRYVAIYDYTSTTKELILLQDLGSNLSPSAGTLLLTMPGTGLIVFS